MNHRYDLSSVLRYWYPNATIEFMAEAMNFYKPHTVDILAVLYLSLAKGSGEREAMDKARKEVPELHQIPDNFVNNALTRKQYLQRNYFGQESRPQGLYS